MNDAVKVRMEGGVLDEFDAKADVVLSDTMDQYRTFQMCERLLHSPTKLANQLLFQIPPHRQATLIERWWLGFSLSNFMSLTTTFLFYSMIVLHSFLNNTLRRPFVLLRLDTMPLMMYLCERFWERNSPKEQRKIWMTSVPRQVWCWKAAEDR